MVWRRFWQRAVLVAALALAGCVASETPERVVERRVDGPAPIRGEAALRAAMLTGHNDARRSLGLTPLVWDDALAADARGYAEILARTRRFEHSREHTGQGENLWTGTRDAYRYDEMIGHWVDERRMFRMGPAPAFSTTGNGADVAHYTQIVWRATTRVGCATASTPRDDYLVCRYTPTGNVIGQRPY